MDKVEFKEKKITKLSPLITNDNIYSSRRKNKSIFNIIQYDKPIIKPMKNDLQGEIDYLNILINKFSYNLIHNIHKIENHKEENRIFSLDIKKARKITNDINKNNSENDGLGKLISIYINKGYKIPKLSPEENNIFKENPLLQNKKNINHYYREKVKLKNKNKKTKKPLMGYRKYTVDNDKHYSFLSSFSDLVFQAQHNKTKYLSPNKIDERRKALNKSSLIKKREQLKILKKENVNYEKDIEKLKQSIAQTEANEKENKGSSSSIYYKSKSPKCQNVFNKTNIYSNMSINNLSTLSSVQTFNNIDMSESNTKNKKNIKRKFIKTILTDVNLKAKNINKKQNEIEELFILGNKVNFTQYAARVKKYFSNKDIHLTTITQDDVPIEFKKMMVNLKRKQEEYNVKEIWKTNFIRVNTSHRCHSLDKLEKLDNDLLNLENKYLKSLIKNM